MSDNDLERKFRALTIGILPADQAEKLMRMCWAITTLDDAGSLPRSTVAS